MKMSKLGYFFEFLLFPPLVLIGMLLAFRSSAPPQPTIWAMVYCAGLVTWTLIEPPRVYRRLQLLRGWSHGQAAKAKVFT